MGGGLRDKGKLAVNWDESQLLTAPNLNEVILYI